MSRTYKMLLRTFGKWLPMSRHPFGKISNQFRVWCARKIGNNIGDNVLIEKGADLQSDITVKDNGAVGVNCYIGSGTIIEENVIMAPECQIFTRNKKFDEKRMRVEGYNSLEPVTIRKNCWIGSRVIILPGVTIGEGCIIGAGSVVTKDMDSYQLIAGNPAEPKKSLIK